MGRGIVKLHDSSGTPWYFEWSTISDAPVTYRMTREELREYIKGEYGEKGLRELPDRMKRVDKKGTSFVNDPDAESTIVCNRAGPNETWWSEQEIADNITTETKMSDQPEWQPMSKTILLTVDEAADRLRRSVNALNIWRSRGGGPQYVKMGSRVFYRERDIEEFIEGKTRRSTDEATETTASHKSEARLEAIEARLEALIERLELLEVI